MTRVPTPTPAPPPPGALTNKTALVRWAAAYTLPLVSTFSGDTAAKIFRGALRNHVLYFTHDPSSVSQRGGAAPGPGPSAAPLRTPASCGA